MHAPSRLIAEPSESDYNANEIISSHSLWALGSSAVPLPYFDLAALTVIQASLIRKLADAYGTTYKFDLAKELIGLVLTSGIYLGLSSPTRQLFKLIPGLGVFAGVLSGGIVGAASTHALGKVFQQHFSSGGTFLSFDPIATREEFKAQFESAKEIYSMCAAIIR